MDKFKINRLVKVEEEVSFNQYIALKVKDLRIKKGYTQESFSDLLNLSRVSVVNFEKGRQQISIKNLYLICKALDVKSSDIIPF